MHSLTRRNFMRIGAGSVAAGATAKMTLLQPAALWGAGRPVAASDRVRFASIGTGTRGCELLQASIAVPGIECVAISTTAATKLRRRPCRKRFQPRAAIARSSIAKM